MLIDWFTVGAQALNFIVLVWLLKRFLYKRVLDALDAREKKIAGELADADSRKAEAGKERDAFREKSREFDRQREDLLDKARDEARAVRERLVEEARKDANALRARRQEALLREQQGLEEEIARRTREEVFAIARKTLNDLAGAGLEESMCDVFVRRLRELDEAAKKDLVEGFRAAEEPVIVRSAFGLPAKQQEAIQQAIGQIFPEGIRARFETTPEVIGGIELSANGRKVAWSIAGYLASLEKSVGDLIKAQPQPGNDPASSGQAK